MEDILHVMLYVDLPENEPETTNMIDNALLMVIHVSRCTVNHTMQTSPGSMVYNRDIMINVLLISNLIAIGRRSQQLVEENTQNGSIITTVSAT